MFDIVVDSLRIALALWVVVFLLRNRSKGNIEGSPASRLMIAGCILLLLGLVVALSRKFFSLELSFIASNRQPDIFFESVLVELLPLILIAIALWLWITFQAKSHILHKINTEDLAENTRALSKNKAWLRQSEQRFLDISGLAADWFWETGFDSRFTYISDQVETITGIPPTQYIGHTRVEVYGDVFDLETPEWQSYLSKISDQRPFHNFELLWTIPDGETIVVSISGTPRFDENGNYAGYRGVGKDITFIRNTEEALLKATKTDEMLSNLLDNITGAAYRCQVDAQWSMEYISREIETICGYPASDFIDNSVRTYASIIHPEDAVFVDREIRQALINGKTFDIEYRIVHANGQHVWLSERGRYCEPKDSQIEFTEGVLYDITQSHAAEQALKEARKADAMYKNLVDNIAGAAYVCLLDDDWTMEYVSQGVESLCGYPPSDFINNLKRSWASITHPEDIATINDIINISVRDKTIYELEFRIIHANGDTRWVWERGHACENDAGKVTHLEGVFADISEIKHSEQKLLIAKAESDAAAIAKSQFLSTMSHEIRTPMNGVIGMAELMEDTPLNMQQKDYLDTITRSGNSLLTIINDILDFSKLDADMTEVEAIRFDLERVCQESMKLISSKTDKNIDLIFDYSPNCPRHFFGDPSRIRQILINLLSNANKFTHQGIIRVGVSMQPVEGGIPLLRLEVEDSGIGIKPEAIDALFSEFTQADQATTRKYGGTGLGLAISKKLIALMKGDIGINSTYGEGSCFWITLPLAVAPSPAPLPNVTLEGVEILFIDDNSENRRVFEHILRHMKAIPTCLEKPEQAIKILQTTNKRNSPFKIAIIDHDMPNISGLTLGNEIRKLNEFDDLKLLAFSSIGKKGDAASFSHAGFDAYLNKPCLYQTLSVILSTMLKHEKDQPIITQHSVEEAKQSSNSKQIRFKGAILLAEDILPNQLIAKKFLRDMGFSVDIANNGQEAVDAFKKNKYDAIFMDCRMPIMDGYDATRKIRQMEQKGSKIPIIALTANASKEDRNLCEGAGMNDVVTKPYKRADLTNCLQKHLKSLIQD